MKPARSKHCAANDTSTSTSFQKRPAHALLCTLLCACASAAAAAPLTPLPASLSSSSFSLLAAAAADTPQPDVLHQQKLEGGTHATQQYVQGLAARHFDSTGAKWPSHAFVAAVRAAGMQIQGTADDAAEGEGSGAKGQGAGAQGQQQRRRLVLMAMANDLALEQTVPTFLASLAAIKLGREAGELEAAGRKVEEAGAGGSLADHLLLACSSETAAAKCRALGLGSRCVVDEDMALGSKSLPFHSIGFNMIGFAKVKYILNALSLGHDVIFMDTDVVVFQHFIPYVLSMGADVAATVEKCKVVDDKANYAGRPIKGFPMFNIGVTYFRSSPGVLRCVYSWMYDMWTEVQERPRVWDQDVFRKVMFHCTKSSRVRLHAFSPRRLNSYCYRPCGCDYPDSDIKTKVDAHLRPVRAEANGTCPKRLVDRWLLMHFPCAGETGRKAELMQRFSRGGDPGT